MTATTENVNVIPGLDQLMAMLPRDFSLEKIGEKFSEKPCEHTLLLLGLATVLFYQAERDSNPKVNDVFDSLVYCSTSLSVGYGDIFAKTPIGKVIGSALMTFGPAMSGAMLDGRPQPDKQEAILKALENILSELRAGK